MLTTRILLSYPKLQKRHHPHSKRPHPSSPLQITSQPSPPNLSLSLSASLTCKSLFIEAKTSISTIEISESQASSSSLQDLVQSRSVSFDLLDSELYSLKSSSTSDLGVLF